MNKKRIDQTYRLKLGDLLRIPPIRVAEKHEIEAVHIPAVEFPIMYEDDAILAVNKPAGVAVHGGSGVSFGVIEQMRRARPQAKFLELVHRLDRETSGVLLLAKKRSALTAMHEIMREGNSDKRYFALVLGQWKNAKQHVKLPLHKFDTPQGEKRVMVREDGQASHTIFALQKSWPEFQFIGSATQDRTHPPDPRASRAPRLSDRRRRQVRRLRAQQGVDEAGIEAHVPACLQHRVRASADG